MAELTQLESKLGEVLGLAQAAQDSTEKVLKMLDDEQIAEKLERMRDEAAEAEKRCLELAEGLDGKKTALQEKARETKSEAQDMMKTYLRDHADALEGLEFLLMAEAGELGHVEIIGKLNEQARNPQVQELVDWVLPIQERHFKDTREAALAIAAREDPNEPA